MSLYNAVEDARKLRQPNAPGRIGIDFQNVTFTGTGSVVFPEFVQVLSAVIDQVTNTSPGVGPSTFTYVIDAQKNKVDLFSWQPTSNANPTLVAGTTPATVSVMVVGIRREGQSI